jgi:hypothetical protein
MYMLIRLFIKATFRPCRIYRCYRQLQGHVHVRRIYK